MKKQEFWCALGCPSISAGFIHYLVNASPYAAFSMFYLEKLEIFKERSTKGMLLKCIMRKKPCEDSLTVSETFGHCKLSSFYLHDHAFQQWRYVEKQGQENWIEWPHDGVEFVREDYQLSTEIS